MNQKFKRELLKLMYENNLCEESPCTEEENRMYFEMTNEKKELPFDIVRCEYTNGAKSDKFKRIIPFDISYEDIQKYCQLKQAKNINIIKNCVIFFTVAIAISLLIMLLPLLLQL